MQSKDTPEGPPPTLSTCSAMKDIAKYAFWPIVGMFFHPVYSVVNAAVVGRMET